MSALKVGIEAFSLFEQDGDQRSFHYEYDHDLTVNTKAASQGGEVAALLLVELGIDSYPAHRVRLGVGVCDREGDAFFYESSGDEVRILTDAIETLTALRDRLALIEAVPSAWSGRMAP